ncbi:hypothetical protein Hanom_Chr00s001915g01689351 [Helianthus anomalus]
MFRHLIDQLQHLVDLHGFPPPPPPIPTVPPSSTTVLAPPLHLHDYSCDLIYSELMLI